jgi:hypothetical protein
MRKRELVRRLCVSFYNIPNHRLVYHRERFPRSAKRLACLPAEARLHATSHHCARHRAAGTGRNCHRNWLPILWPAMWNSHPCHANVGCSLPEPSRDMEKADYVQGCPWLLIDADHALLLRRHFGKQTILNAFQDPMMIQNL